MKHDDREASAQPLALVTGATGFVGSHLAELLLASGWRVRALVRNPEKLVKSLQGKVETAKASLTTDPTILAPMMRDVDVVFHVAGLIGAVRQAVFDRANVGGTCNMIEALRVAHHTPKRFLLVSSLAAFGPCDDLGRPRRESDDDRAQPRTMYGRSKLEGEKLAWHRCKDYGIPLTVVRPSAVYGPRDRAIFEFFKYMAKGIEVGIGSQPKYLDLIHVRDLVRGILLAATNEASVSRAYYLSDEGGHELHDIMLKLREVMRPRANRTLRVPLVLVKAAAKLGDVAQLLSGRVIYPNTDKLNELLPQRWTCDASRARAELGFACEVPLIEGLRECSDWYEEQGWLHVRR